MDSGKIKFQKEGKSEEGHERVLLKKRREKQVPGSLKKQVGEPRSNHIGKRRKHGGKLGGKRRGTVRGKSCISVQRH